MDIVTAVQEKFRHVSNEAMVVIAKELQITQVEVRSLVSFYAFFSDQPKGEIIIRICNDVVDVMKGVETIAQAFVDELGISFGETSKDGKFSLEHTPCIGMCDQAPAILINEVVYTNLTADKVKEIIAQLKSHGDPKKLVTTFGDGNNANELVRSMVNNNIQKEGKVIFAEREAESGLKKALLMKPEEVINEVKASPQGGGIPHSRNGIIIRSHRNGYHGDQRRTRGYSEPQCEFVCR